MFVSPGLKLEGGDCWFEARQLLTWFSWIKMKDQSVFLLHLISEFQWLLRVQVHHGQPLIHSWQHDRGDSRSVWEPLTLAPLSLSESSMTLIIMGSVIEWKCCHLPVIAAQSGSNTHSVLLRRGQTFTSVCASIFLLYMLFTLSEVPDVVCTARFLSVSHSVMNGFVTVHYIV